MTIYSDQIATKNKKPLVNTSSDKRLYETLSMITSVIAGQSAVTRCEIDRSAGFLQLRIWALTGNVAYIHRLTTETVRTELASPIIWRQSKNVITGDILDFPGQILIYPV